MTSRELKELQFYAEWSNRDVARMVGRTEQTVSNWRTDRQVIPPYVALILHREAKEVKGARDVRREPPRG